MCVSGEERGQKAETEKVEEGRTRHNKTRVYSHAFPLVRGSQAHLAQIAQSQAAERLLRVLPSTQERTGGLSGDEAAEGAPTQEWPGGLGGVLPLR